MTNKIRSITAANATLSIFFLAFLSPAQASPSDDQSILNAARQLGLAPHHAPVQQTSRQQIKRQQILRRDAAQKQARLVQLRRIRLQQLNQQKRRNINAKRVSLAQKQVINRQANDVWRRVYQGFRLPNHNYRPLVRRFINEFSRNPVRIERLSERASDYLFMVVNELNRRRMPTELALLPFVESAYRNTAFSHAGAAGMWQFIPSTGRIYGLKQTSSYDARMDSFEATRAALDYLQKLNREFRGDWLLTLAAYNAGENRVHREIMENRSRGLRTDYWSLGLPKETRQYVPRLLAFKEILHKPYAYRVRLRPIPNTPALTQIRVNKPVDLRKAATHAGLPANSLASLNPGYLHGITTPRFSKRIILPRRYAGRINKVIQRLPPAKDVHYKPAYRYAKYTKKRNKRYRSKKRNRYITHKVRSGDNLYRIALKHGTTVKKIKQLNKMRSNKIWPGKRLKISSARKYSKRRHS